MWKFIPILKTTIWGGDKIASFKQLRDISGPVGESWELSSVEGCESVVSEGPEAGLRLSELLVKYGSAILGERNFKKFGTRFPLLVKYIDARENLSVQVHPDNDMAQRLGMVNGKSEMWYVLEAEEYSRIGLGFREPVSPEEFDDLVREGRIEEKLRYLPVKPGEAYYIPAGRVHTIGTGTLLVEIQQTSDATFRIYDYNRRDTQGQERELHAEQAREAINLNDTEGAVISYMERTDIPLNLVKCPSFTTNVMILDEEVMRDYAELDSFVVLIVTRGSGRLYCGADAVANEPTVTDVRCGDTVLVSASAKGLTIEPGDKGMKLLETYVG